MGADFYLNKISRKRHNEFIDIAKQNNMSIEDFYGNFGFEELENLGEWSKSRFFSKALNERGIKTGDCCQVELSLPILSQIKNNIIEQLETMFKQYVIDKVSSYQIVNSNWDYESNVTKLIYMINAINTAINEVDFDKEIVLYHESL
jgi:hypothetical protein